jgi:hypothetical protein
MLLLLAAYNKMREERGKLRGLKEKELEENPQPIHSAKT